MTLNAVAYKIRSCFVEWYCRSYECLTSFRWPSFIYFNTLRPRQNGRRFADDTFKRMFLNEDVRISIKISLKFVPKGPINNDPALVQIMAWRRPDDKPLSEPMMVNLMMHICVTRPQWVKLSHQSIALDGWEKIRFWTKISKHIQISWYHIVVHDHILLVVSKCYFLCFADKCFNMVDCDTLHSWSRS